MTACTGVALLGPLLRAIPTQLLKPQIIGFQVGLLIRHVPVFSLYDVPRVGNPAEDKQPQSHHS